MAQLGSIGTSFASKKLKKTGVRILFTDIVYDQGEHLVDNEIHRPVLEQSIHGLAQKGCHSGRGHKESENRTNDSLPQINGTGTT